MSISQCALDMTAGVIDNADMVGPSNQSSGCVRTPLEGRSRSLGILIDSSRVNSLLRRFLIACAS